MLSETLVELVEVQSGFQCYKLDGRGFDSRWYYWNFSLT